MVLELMKQSIQGQSQVPGEGAWCRFRGGVIHNSNQQCQPVRAEDWIDTQVMHVRTESKLETGSAATFILSLHTSDLCLCKEDSCFQSGVFPGIGLAIASSGQNKWDTYHTLHCMLFFSDLLHRMQPGSQPVGNDTQEESLTHHVLFVPLGL